MQPTVCRHSLVQPTFFVLRTPLLPISQLIEVLPPDSNDSRLTILRQWLIKPYVREALFLASPTLSAQIEDWLNVPTAFLSANVELTVWKYLLRMSSRCTPFGLFAGYAIGELTNYTNTKLATDQAKAVTRLDRAVMAQLIRQLMVKPRVRQQINYRLNNSWYQVGHQHRYSEYVGTGDERTVQLTSLVDTEGIQAVLNAFRQSSHKSLSFTELVEAVAYLGHRGADAEAFIDVLIDAQFLHSELEQQVTGTANDELIWHLLRVTEPVNDLPSLPTDSLSLSTLRTIYSMGKSLLGTNQSVKAILQTDATWKTDDSALNQVVVGQVGEQLTRLMVLRSDRLSGGLTRFQNRFYERFGEQSVPLLAALDPDVGVGYGQSTSLTHLSLLNGLQINHTANTSFPPDRLDAWRLTKLTDALRAGQDTIILTDDDLVQLGDSAPKTPPARSWYAHGTLLAESADIIDQGNYQFHLRTAVGPSALNLLGRFATHDEVLTDYLRQLAYWEQQQYPEAILAEVIHLPTDRIGNVVSRPTLRPYEIPYLTHPSVDSEHTILLSDLVVSTPRGQEVILYSNRLKKRIIPRLATAHNFHQGDDVYRFLCDLQHHDQTTQLSWSWGVLQDQPRLPRVVYQRIILARAQWTICRAQTPTNVPAHQVIPKLRAKFGIPRWVAVVDGDNELVLDLDVSICQELLTNELGKRDRVVLVEWLAVPDHCWVTQGKHRFTSEIVVPFGFKATAPLPSHSPSRSAHVAIQRAFPPGSEWLYLKLYASEGIADELLIQFVGPLAHELVSTHVIDNWFFIRYADPEPHLRLRFHCPQRTYAYVLDQFNIALATSGLHHCVHRVQIDTYEREIERYGQSAIESCEVLFGQNSQSVVAWLTAHDGYPNEDQRWLFACQQVEATLTLFARSLTGKLTLLRHLQQAYLTEHGSGKELKQQLNDRYRQWAGKLREALGEQAANYPPAGALAASSARSILATLDNQLDAEEQAKSLITSVLHMTINRIFPSKQRQAELIVYHFMTRHYESLKARSTKMRYAGKEILQHFTE